jgi:hypothetical protein
MQTFGYHNLATDMPACLFEHLDDPFVSSCSDCISKFLERQRVRPNRYGRQHQPEGITTAWADEAIQVHPFVAMLNPHNWPPTFASPHTPYDRLEPNPMLIHRPLFELRIGMGVPDKVQRVRKRFFETLLARLGQLWRAVAAGHTSGSSGVARLPSHAAHAPCGQA